MKRRTVRDVMEEHIRTLEEQMTKKGPDYVMRWDPKDRKRAMKYVDDAVDAIEALREFTYSNPGGRNPKEAAMALPGKLYDDLGRVMGVLEIVSGYLGRW